MPAKTRNHWHGTKAILYKIFAQQQATYVDAIKPTKTHYTLHTHTENHMHIIVQLLVHNQPAVCSDNKCRVIECRNSERLNSQ